MVARRMINDAIIGIMCFELLAFLQSDTELHIAARIKRIVKKAGRLKYRFLYKEVCRYAKTMLLEVVFYWKSREIIVKLRHGIYLAVINCYTPGNVMRMFKMFQAAFKPIGSGTAPRI